MFVILYLLYLLIIGISCINHWHFQISMNEELFSRNHIGKSVICDEDSK